MRTILIVLAVGLFSLGIAGAAVWWKYSRLFDKTSDEIVVLDAGKRASLISLRDERKFEAHDFPPLGYTGVATPEEGTLARSAVNDVLNSILSRQNGPIAAKSVSDLISKGMKRVNYLETEDRDRTADYMIEIWYKLGFRGATGRFAYGAAFPKPPGYGEPLPPGWKSPTEPRPINQQ